MFDCGGNVYRKRSTRTAVIIFSRTYDPDELRWNIHTEHKGVWGYCAQLQPVNQEQKWWVAIGGPA
jgi:hypothetical protein